MKRFWLIMLTLGLITAFSTSAFAADVKFSGQFYAAGMYVDQTSLKKDASDPSTAFYFQRLRVQTEFIVSPALKLVTRFDAMERAWGAARSTSGSTDVDSAGTIAENENIAFDWAYINYKAPIGVFNVGIMNKGTTGTAFGNNIQPAARIKYAYTYGPVFVEVQTSKLEEKSRTAKNPTATWTDADRDEYGIEAAYSWNGGKAGVNVTYNRDARNRPTANNKKVYWQVVPYAMAKVGPVALEAELGYVTGKENDYDNGTTDVKMTGLSAYLDALADFGMFYAGGTFAYVSGDKPGTTKKEGGTLSGGRDWNPCLILFSYYDTRNWVGEIRGHHASATGAVNNAMLNAFFYQGRVGVRPIADLNIMASLAYAYADKKPSASYLEKDYGMEFDVTATYKITNNLTYMLGAGYLWTGDYFKYNSAANKVDDNFMVINKLTVTF